VLSETTRSFPLYTLTDAFCTVCRQRAMGLLLNPYTFSGWVTVSLYHNVTGISF